VMGRVHPVQIYAMVVALMLGAYLLFRLSMPHVAGHVAATALVCGGFAAFVLNMLMQPTESQGNALLDPGQYIALASILLGIGMFLMPKPKFQEFS
jgi:prolipoprotein diacylglyceryltransferase